MVRAELDLRLLDELSELGLGLLGRTSVQSKAAAMITDTLLFVALVGRGDARQRRDGVGERAGMRQEFPGADALYDAPGEAFLAGGAQQAAKEGKQERYPWDPLGSGRVTEYGTEAGQKAILARANTSESEIGGTSPVAMYRWAPANRIS